MARRKRLIFFVCSVIHNNQLLVQEIAAPSFTAAHNAFYAQYNVAPEKISGPYYKKKNKIIESKDKMILSNKIYKAEYHGWSVNAVILKQPEYCAYLIFNEHLTKKNTPKPKGITIVSIYDLRLTT